MRVPILQQGDYLIASVQSSLSDGELLQLRNDLVAKVSKVRARGVIIDVNVLDVMDSFATRILSEIALVIKLRGASTVVVGIQPEVAFTMVQLGLSLEQIKTALDLEEGLDLLDKVQSNGAS